MPDVPTFRELGYNINFNPWQAVFVSANTPNSVKLRINNIIQTALQDPTTIQRFIDLGMERVIGSSISESEKILNEEIVRWTSFFSPK